MRILQFKLFLSIIILFLLVSPLFSQNTLKYVPCSISKYQGNMTLIAQVHHPGGVIVDCQVAVFDKAGECRASTCSTLADGGLVYLTIQGEGLGEPLTFRVIYQDGDNQVDTVATERVTFVNDAMLGTLNEPFVLTVASPPSKMNGVIGIAGKLCPANGGIRVNMPESREVCVFSTDGRMVFEQRVCGIGYIPLPAGIYLVEGKKYVVK